MSPLTEKEATMWVSLRDYADARIAAIEEASRLVRDALSHRVDALENDVALLRETRSELAGKASQSWQILVGVIAVAGLLLALVEFFAK